MRKHFGATARGHSACVGFDTWHCDRRSTANRIRKVIKSHSAAGGWCGPATLRALVDLALERRELSTDAVMQLFARRSVETDLREANAQLDIVIAERDAARAELARLQAQHCPYMEPGTLQDGTPAGRCPMVEHVRRYRAALEAADALATIANSPALSQAELTDACQRYRAARAALRGGL